MPPVDDAKTYDTVATIMEENEKPRSRQLWPRVKILYSQYELQLQSKTGPRAPFRRKHPDHEVLKKHYKKLNNKPLKHVKTKTLKAAGGKCAYCHASPAIAVDHYLPRAVFGEYSIYSQNLTPICTSCNGRKLNRYLGEDAGRRYVHPYFDTLPSTPFIVANVEIDETVVVRFTLEKSKIADPTLAILASQQFSDLHLNERYSEEAVELMRHRRKSIEVEFNRGGAASVRAYLLKEADSLSDDVGESDWSTITLRALAESVDFCDGGFQLIVRRPTRLR